MSLFDNCFETTKVCKPGKFSVLGNEGVSVTMFHPITQGDTPTAVIRLGCRDAPKLYVCRESAIVLSDFFSELSETLEE